MPKSKLQKKDTVKNFVDNFGKAKMVVLSDYKGLKVKEITALRKELNQNQVDCEVVKKTMMNLAFKEMGIDFNAKTLPGNIIGVSFGFGDQVAPAKIVANFAKTHEAMKVLGGFLEGKFIDGQTVKTFAALPSREQLLAKMVGSIQAPLSGFVQVLSGNLRGLVQILNARKEKLSV